MSNNMSIEEKKKNIARELKEGKTYDEIASKYKVSKSTVRKLKLCKEEKMPEKKQGPEFLSFLTFGTLLVLWALLIQGREFTLKDFIISLIFFLDATYIFYEMKKHRY